MRSASYELRTGAGAKNLPFVARPKKAARKAKPKKRAALNRAERVARVLRDPAVVDSRSSRTASGVGLTYQRELVKCGKCAKCGRQACHGPYWYAYWTIGNRTLKRYIGADFRELADRDLVERTPRTARRRRVVAGGVRHLIDSRSRGGTACGVRPAASVGSGGTTSPKDVTCKNCIHAAGIVAGGPTARRRPALGKVASSPARARRTLPKTARARAEPVGRFFGRNIQRGVAIYRRPGAKPDELVESVRVHEVQGKKALVTFGITRAAKWVRIEQIAMI